ncbi:hypothetical protein L9F63_006790, partial [Diploptera punctata]
ISAEIRLFYGTGFSNDYQCSTFLITGKKSLLLFFKNILRTSPKCNLLLEDYLLPLSITFLH